jgi:hypothetical protein
MAWNDEVVTPQGSAVPSQTVCLAGNATLSVTADGVEIKNDTGNPVPVSGTVTANVADPSNVIQSGVEAGILAYAADLANDPLPISGTVTANVGNLPLATSPNNWETIGDQIGTGLNAAGLNVDVASLPAISGTVTANAGTGTFTTSDRGATGQATATSFTSTSSASLKASNSSRKLLTIYNEGAGNLYVLYGNGTASSTNYSVRLAAGDYLEIEKYTGDLTGIFATAGTAYVTEITS